MIRPELKEVYSREVFTSLNEYIPQNRNFFELELILIIGIEGQDGGDIFYLNICTPKWIEALHKNNIYSKHDKYLIIEEYNFQKIEQDIINKLSGVSGNNWIEVAQKISSFAKWEFDNYQEF